MTVRVRIAPSPTGLLHVGNARAALFNWLFARRHEGEFILRIDDTDRARSTAEFEEENMEALRWLGLTWDEGVGVGGPHGGYRQSERIGRYQDVAASLLDQEVAYYDSRSPEELEALRQRARDEGKPPMFYIRKPETASAEPSPGAVLRLAIGEGSAVEFLDEVRGDMRFEREAVDDFVLLRSDGSPTYHLASTVDDVDYAITHVARGEDLLSSTPKHILLATAMGAESPTYAHLPLLFGPDGKKLSKRHGDVSVAAYRQQGYLAEALFNYLALLGWSYDAETTYFTPEEAAARFELGSVSKNPAIFDPVKLQAMNGHYIRSLPTDEFLTRVRPLLEEAGDIEEEAWAKVETLGAEVQERVALLPEAKQLIAFLVTEVDYDESSWNKAMRGDDLPDLLSEATERLRVLDPWTTADIEETLRDLLEKLELSARKGLQPLRVAVTGSTVSPPLFESIHALGRTETVSRLERALSRFKKTASNADS